MRARAAARRTGGGAAFTASRALLALVELPSLRVLTAGEAPLLEVGLP